VGEFARGINGYRVHQGSLTMIVVQNTDLMTKIIKFGTLLFFIALMLVKVKNGVIVEALIGYRSLIISPKETCQVLATLFNSSLSKTLNLCMNQ
jgi:hypothetical protein